MRNSECQAMWVNLGEWLSLRRFTSKLSWSCVPCSIFNQGQQINQTRTNVWMDESLPFRLLPFRLLPFRLWFVPFRLLPFCLLPFRLLWKFWLFPFRLLIIADKDFFFFDVFYNYYSHSEMQVITQGIKLSKMPLFYEVKILRIYVCRHVTLK